MRLSAFALALLGLSARATGAEKPLAVGLFAPSAPFTSTSERLEFANALAQKLAERLGAPSGLGRVYARGSDLANAVKRGELDFAVVDAAYAATQNLPYPVLAAAMRNGATSSPWEIVARPGIKSLLDLRGKGVAIPTTAGREESFLYQVLLEGEMGAARFGRIAVVPDAASAALAVSLGRADAACVPSGLRLPTGVSHLVTLARVSWPLLIALPGPYRSGAEKAAAAATATAMTLPGAFERFQRASTDVARTLAGRLAQPRRRGLMAVPAGRLPAAALLDGRTFELRRIDILELAAAPKPVP